MTPDLLKDLASWERGEMTRDEILRRYGNDVRSLMAVHERITALAGATPSPDADPGWESLAPKLDAHVVRLGPATPRRRRRRVVTVALAAALTLGGSALAAVGPRVLGGHEPNGRPEPAGADVSRSSPTGVETLGPSPSGSHAPTPTTPGGALEAQQDRTESSDEPVEVPPTTEHPSDHEQHQGDATGPGAVGEDDQGDGQGGEENVDPGTGDEQGDGDEQGGQNGEQGSGGDDQQADPSETDGDGNDEGAQGQAGEDVTAAGSDPANP